MLRKLDPGTPCTMDTDDGRRGAREAFQVDRQLSADLPSDSGRLRWWSCCRRWCGCCSRRRQEQAQLEKPSGSTEEADSFHSFTRSSAATDGRSWAKRMSARFSRAGSIAFQSCIESGSTDDLENPWVLLGRLQAIEKKCLGTLDSGAGVPDAIRTMSTDCLIDKPGERFWICSMHGSAHVTTCLDIHLTSITRQDFIFAVCDGEERLRWDSASFKGYEVLQQSWTLEDQMSYDLLYCVIPTPWPLENRDILQKRWQLPLPDGAWAILWRSVDDPTRPPPKKVTRAFTEYSGFILRPCAGKEGEFDLTMISCMDFGGSIPQGLQNQLRKTMKGKPGEWTRKLENHCRSLSKSG